jgi:hypothetical protein
MCKSVIEVARRGPAAEWPNICGSIPKLGQEGTGGFVV